MDRHYENKLLRMTKDELIDHIYYLYQIYDGQLSELSRWYTASEEIINLRKNQFKDE